MKVSQYKVGTRRFVAFIDRHEIPVEPLANAFIYDVFLSASFSTKVRVAQELKTVLDYFSSVSIVLEERISSGSLLTSSEISAFYGMMRLKKEAFKYENKISVFPSIESKNIRNAISASMHDQNKASIETTTGRVRTLRKYLTYLYSYFHDDRSPPLWLSDAYATMIAKIKAKESYSAGKSNSRSVELVESVIPDDVYENIFECH